MRLAEEIDDGLGHGRTDAFDIVEFDIGFAPAVTCSGKHCVAKCFGAAIGAGEKPRRDLADMRNAERIDEAVELDLAPRLDGGEQLRRGRLAPPFPRLEFRRGTAVAAGKREDVLR